MEDSTATVPPGMMKVKGADGQTRRYWISTYLALKNATTTLSPERLRRIEQSSRFASQVLLTQSILFNVTYSTTCAVKYTNQVWYGTVRRYGYKGKCGVVSELQRPVSLEDRPAGLVFHFSWLKPDPSAPDGSNIFVRSCIEFLDEGAFVSASEVVLLWCCDCLCAPFQHVQPSP